MSQYGSIYTIVVWNLKSKYFNSMKTKKIKLMSNALFSQ